MDKAQAWHTFWSSFGWDAYDENTVPDDAQLPYITYEYVDANLDKPVTVSINLWYRSHSWEEITAKSTEISHAIGYGGTTIRFDEGIIYLTLGTPFAQRLSGDDDSVRRIIITPTVEFLSAA